MWSFGGNQIFLIAIAILLGSGFAGFVYYESKTPALAEDLVTIQRFAREERNLYGAARAPITIVEFSDYECPYCAKLHPDLKRIIDESDGAIAWEYRHLPLRIHELALPAAIASECVAEHISRDAFWEFTNTLFDNQTLMSEEYIEKTALELGLTTEALDSCKVDPSLLKRIETDTEVARALGGTGTPFSIIIYPDDSYKIVSGAVPYEQWQQFLNVYEK